jgi:hypothetical protein
MLGTNARKGSAALHSVSLPMFRNERPRKVTNYLQPSAFGDSVGNHISGVHIRFTATALLADNYPGIFQIRKQTDSLLYLIGTEWIRTHIPENTEEYSSTY